MPVFNRSQPPWSLRLTRAAVAVVGLAAGACTGDAPTEPARAPAAALAVADSGSRFTFLAPLGGGTADSASFDAAAAPAVEICVWTGAACAAGGPVARFSTAPTGTDRPITVNRSVGQYEASWSLLDPAFTTRRTYRVAVLDSGAVAGTVLVDVVRGRYALTRSDGTQAPLASASTLPIRFTLRQASEPPPAEPCNDGVLENGLTCTGTIATAREEDRWTFTAAAGAYFAVGVGADTATGIHPAVRVVSPAGVVVEQSYRGNATAEARGQAPVAGTYTVIVSDGSNTGRTGAYRVTLALGPGPAVQVSAGDQGGALANGATYAAAFYTGDLDTWTFTATSGASVSVQMTRTGSSTLASYVRVISPAGVVVATGYSGGALAQANFTVPASGTYTVITSDGSNGGRTGAYTLSMTATSAAQRVALLAAPGEPDPAAVDVTGGLR